MQPRPPISPAAPPLPPTCAVVEQRPDLGLFLRDVVVHQLRHVLPWALVDALEGVAGAEAGDPVGGQQEVVEGPAGGEGGRGVQ